MMNHESLATSNDFDCFNTTRWWHSLGSKCRRDPLVMGNPWIPIDNPWAPMDDPWISSDYQWISMDHPWISHDYLANHGLSLDPHG
jgi:hypothetical protein